MGIKIHTVHNILQNRGTTINDVYGIPDMAEFELNSISICSHFSRTENKSLNDYIKTISKLDTPGPLRNRIVEIEEEESQLGIGIVNEGNPIESESNYLIIDDFQSDNCHVHIECEQVYIDDFLQLFSDIVDIAGQITVDPITYYMSIDKGFEELDIDLQLELPDKLDKEIHQVSGIRFDLGSEDSDYLLQMNPRDTEKTQLRHGRGSIEVDSDSAENLIQSELEEASEVIKEL